jgi:hypothetical protein
MAVVLLLVVPDEELVNGGEVRLERLGGDGTL